MNSQIILDLLEKYGISGGIVVVVVTTTVSILRSDWLASLLNKASNSLIKGFMNNNIKEDVNNSDITHHDIFNYMDFWINSKIPTLQFSTEYRTMVFRKYLTLYLRSYKKNIKNFIDNEGFREMDNNELSTSFINTINQIIHDYERDSELAGIPRVVINKMKLRNNDTISLTLDLIQNINSSMFYKSEDNLLKVYSILNIILSILDNTITNSEGVCNNINGQMKGLEYKEDGVLYVEP